MGISNVSQHQNTIDRTTESTDPAGAPQIDTAKATALGYDVALLRSQEPKELPLWHDGWDSYIAANGRAQTKVEGLTPAERAVFDAAYGKALASFERAMAAMASSPMITQTALLQEGGVAHPKDSELGLSLNEAAKDLKKQLVDKAHEALAAPTFEERNNVHAAAVGDESGLLAAMALGKTSPEEIRQLQSVFRSVARDAGGRFRTAFDRSGAKEADREKEYKSAMGAASDVAYNALAERIGRERARALVVNAALEDIGAIVAKDLKLGAEVTQMSGPELKAMIKKITPQDDYFFSKIDEIPVRMEGQRLLNETERDQLSLGTRLANAAWKGGQAHRSAWEGNDSRINPDKRPAYNPYDVLKVEMFNQTVLAAGKNSVGGSDRDQLEAQKAGFARVVFEVYKDVLELKKAEAQLSR